MHDGPLAVDQNTPRRHAQSHAQLVIDEIELERFVSAVNVSQCRESVVSPASDEGQCFRKTDSVSRWRMASQAEARPDRSNLIGSANTLASQLINEAGANLGVLVQIDQPAQT